MAHSHSVETLLLEERVLPMVLDRLSQRSTRSGHIDAAAVAEIVCETVQAIGDISDLDALLAALT